VSSGYIIVRCPRCFSTSEISRNGVRTHTFLCPVCLEGEIQYKENQSVIEKEPELGQLNQTNHLVTLGGTFATNLRQELEKSNAEVDTKVFSIWRTGLHLN
jgi:hypothetical protein